MRAVHSVGGAPSRLLSATLPISPSNPKEV
jgi:hypothetical protein